MLYELIKKIFKVLAPIILVGCAHANIDIKDRTTYWMTELDRNIPTGTPQRKIREWCLTRNIYCSHSEEKHNVRGDAEIIKSQGAVSACSDLRIVLNIALDDSGQSVSNKVETIGSCL